MLATAFAILAVASVAAQDGAICEAAQPAVGLTTVNQTLAALAAPQSFDIGNATGVRARDLRGEEELHATCYDDGASCPGGCDPHVVANNATNGSARFHAPGSTPGDWQDCRNGQDCEVCFGDDPADCITVAYRGTGPDAGRADFTAEFWAELCGVEGLPEALAGECERIDSGSERLRALSCLDDPQADGCEGIVPSEAERRAAQQAVQECLAERDNSWRCYYQGPNGTLSAGACEGGAVNSSGWDCCSGDRFHDACVTGCGEYYVDGDPQPTVEGAAVVEGPELVDEAPVDVEPEVEEPAPVGEPALHGRGEPPPLRWRPFRPRRPRPGQRR
jgi:hypothetical protein